ncbi:DUF742 domain-containing protein [Sinosporangium siamense]|uniref:DUF742 domain-containing protein n=1 Tax=Sinosporangium siamense TaxID=1367973 RepID=A0A919RL45_9ACTN|nr:DUF742 domain-containing protein [Sinosporangium siamense]GII94835.1 hypothetical protein Ssi02_50660 [Sinosporangium siamense]
MRSPEEFNEDRWLDEEAGPIVRPYVMTRGRTEPTRGKFDLISLVVATRTPSPVEIGLGPEHLTILRLCDDFLSVAEIAARMDLPAGTIRVLLGDLLDRGFIDVQEPHPETELDDDCFYQAVIDGLRSL